MRRRGWWLSTLVVIATIFPSLTPASVPGVGSAETSTSLFSVGVSHDGANVQTFDLMTGVGSATNDPAKNSVQLAEVALALARADGAVDIDSAPFDVSARAEGPGASSQSDTDLALSLEFGEALTGAVTVASVEAGVDPESASARLSQVEAGASVMGGLVSLTGVTIVGVSAESSPESAESSQTVRVDQARLFNLEELLEQFDRYFSDLAAGDLAALAERFLGPDAGDELEAAVAEHETILGHLNDLDYSVGMLENGVPEVSDVDAMATIYELATEYGVDPSYCPLPDPLNPCDVVDMALQTAALVELAIAEAEALALAAVDEAFADLDAELSELPLLTLNDVEVSVSAHAEDGNSTATSTISWGSAEVAGQPVPFADLQEASVPLSAALADVLNDLAEAFGAEFGLNLSFPASSNATGTDGDYETAAASASAFSMSVSGLSKSGTETSVGMSLMSMSANADHKAPDEVVDDDPGSDDTPSTEDDPAEDDDPAEESDSEVLGNNQGAQDESEEESTTQSNQPGNPAITTSQGAPPPDLNSPTLPRTGADSDRLLLLACQLILLGWALHRRGSNALAKTSASAT